MRGKTHPHRPQQQDIEIIIRRFALLQAQKHVDKQSLHGGQELVGIEIWPLFTFVSLVFSVLM
jgi:hypothetical protein